MFYDFKIGILFIYLIKCVNLILMMLHKLLSAHVFVIDLSDVNVILVNCLRLVWVSHVNDMDLCMIVFLRNVLGNAM